MTLKENEEASILFAECVDTCIFGTRQQLIPVFDQIFFRQAIPPRVRQSETQRYPFGQDVTCDTRAIEDSAMLALASNARDTIHVLNCRMRSQAGPDRRVGVVLRPIEDGFEALPVWLVR